MAVTLKPPTNEADNDSPELLVPANTEANITEIRGNKTIQYIGKVKSPNAPEEEIEIENEDIFNNDISASEMERNKRFAFPQTLTEFASCLSHFAGEELYLVVTRLTDAYDEKYNFPAKRELQFAPVPFDAVSILFILVDILHKLNHNSGGRFKVEVANRAGQTMEDVFLINFAVPDPMRSDSEIIANAGNNSNSENNNFLMLINEMREDRKMFFEMFQNQNTQQPQSQPQSLMEQLDVLEKLKNLTGGNSEEKESRLEKTVSDIFSGVTVAEALAERIATKFGGNDDSKVHPLLQPFATEENAKLILQNGFTLFNNVATIADRAIAAKQTQNQNTAAGNQTVTGEVLEANEIPQQPQPQQNPNPQPPPLTQEQIDNMQNEMITEMLTELESDRPLDSTNPFLNSLGVKYPEITTRLINLCKTLPFDTVVTMLDSLVPDKFAELYMPDPESTDGEEILTERGTKIMERLEELYNLLRNVQIQQNP